MVKTTTGDILCLIIKLGEDGILQMMIILTIPATFIHSTGMVAMRLCLYFVTIIVENKLLITLRLFLSLVQYSLVLIIVVESELWRLFIEVP